MHPVLDTDITYVKGVGPARGKLFRDELGITTVRDMLMYFPFRHIDRSRFYRIKELGGLDIPNVQVKGQFISFREEGEGAKKRLIGIFSDGVSLMETVWFSGIQKIKNIYTPGKPYVMMGKPQLFRNAYTMAHPEIEDYDPQKPPSGLRGIYSLTEKMRKRGITQRIMQTIVKNILENPTVTAALSDPLPQRTIIKHSLMPYAKAIRGLHMPADSRELQLAGERMKFEELYYLQLNILRTVDRRHKSTPGNILSQIGDKFNGFYSGVLPFALTAAQKRVLREIRDDMRTGRQMNRLLQGDVGSGKTMVAFMTMLMGIDNGLQSCLMAPTEILATQHYESLREWGKAMGVRIELLTGSTRSRKRRDIHDGLLSGEIHILVGTHALIEEKVEFRRLGIAIIDEQHRFGVAQRAKLWKKAEVPPHILVMTATPIPRTLALTVYGDLDVSIIDELPPGRKPVDTLLRYDDNRMEVYRLVARELQAGRQVYIVYPLVKENEKLTLKSVEEGYHAIQEVFPDYRVCCAHGQLKPDAKDYQMNLFVSGTARIMVATTVIEVGVNVPNASVMVIENAERFGLSQLHQLRGRVGRGADKSYCVLMTKRNIAAMTRKRLGIMTETTDGFLISEADMKMRGPGDMEGTMQSGIAFDLKIANLSRDGQYVEAGRRDAEETIALARRGALDSAELELLGTEMHRRFNKSHDWSQIS